MDGIAWFCSTILIGFLAFVATNIDDLLLLIFLFSLTDWRKRDIVIGQYLGFVVIIVVSSLGFLSKWVVPLKWLGFLGLVPIALGILALRRLFRKQKLADQILYLPPRDTVFGSLPIYTVAAMTVGNGSDNIATYIPLFATENLIGMGVVISFFLLLVAVWCYIGYTLVSFPTVADITKRYGYVLLPFVFITLGILIMIKAGTLV